MIKDVTLALQITGLWHIIVVIASDWVCGPMTTFECVSAWQTLMPSWIANKASLFGKRSPSPSLPPVSHLRHPTGEKKASYGLFQWTTFKYLHSSSECKHTAHVIFRKIVYLTIFTCNCLRAQDSNYSFVSLPGVNSFQLSHKVTKLRNKSLLCQNCVKYF